MNKLLRAKGAEVVQNYVEELGCMVIGILWDRVKGRNGEVLDIDDKDRLGLLEDLL